MGARGGRFARRSGHRTMSGKPGHQPGHGANTERRYSARLCDNPDPRCAAKHRGGHINTHRSSRSDTHHKIRRRRRRAGHGVERPARAARRSPEFARHRASAGKPQTHPDSRSGHTDSGGRTPWRKRPAHYLETSLSIPRQRFRERWRGQDNRKIFRKRNTFG